MILIVLAILGPLHILTRTSTYGSGLSPDSAGYLSIASNLAEGEGSQDSNGRGILPWPFLFPLLLAAFDLVGIEPLEAGRWVNIATFGLIVLLGRFLVTPEPHVVRSGGGGHRRRRDLAPPLRLVSLIWGGTVFTALAAVTRYAGVTEA